MGIRAAGAYRCRFTHVSGGKYTYIVTWEKLPARWYQRRLREFSLIYLGIPGCQKAPSVPKPWMLAPGISSLPDLSSRTDQHGLPSPWHTPRQTRTHRCQHTESPAELVDLPSSSVLMYLKNVTTPAKEMRRMFDATTSRVVSASLDLILHKDAVCYPRSSESGSQDADSREQKREIAPSSPTVQSDITHVRCKSSSEQ